MDGYYRITGYSVLDAGIGSLIQTLTLSVRINGSTFIASIDGDLGIRIAKQVVVADYHLSAGDYAEITINASVTVGTPTVLSSGNISPEASIDFLGV